MSTVQIRGRYSAGVGRVFYLEIVDRTNEHLVPDDIVTAIDEARALGGVCLTCARSFEHEAPAAFAVIRRAGGFEPPTARAVCATCSSKFDRADLRYRALEAVHRGPGR
jgi:hypothetical protein